MYNGTIHEIPQPLGNEYDDVHDDVRHRRGFWNASYEISDHKKHPKTPALVVREFFVAVPWQPNNLEVDMPTDLGVNQASVERIIKALTDGVISTGKEVVMRHTLAVLEQEASKAGMGYITDDAKRRIKAALSE